MVHIEFLCTSTRNLEEFLCKLWRGFLEENIKENIILKAVDGRKIVGTYAESYKS